MTARAKQLLEQMLALDEDDRTELCGHLSESLSAERNQEYDAAWESELKERIADVERGDVKLIPWRQVIESLGRKDTRK